MLWLQDYLSRYRHTVLVVSHDRGFLNEVCTDMVVFDKQKLAYHRGNFDSFARATAERRANQTKEWDAYVKERAHIQEFIDKFRANAKRASMVQSRIKMVEKMDAEAPDEPEPDETFSFSFPPPEPIGRPIIQLDEVSFAYSAASKSAAKAAAAAAKARAGAADTAATAQAAATTPPGGAQLPPLPPPKPLFVKVDWSVDLDTRVGIVGPNGAGKSTLLNLVLEKLAPTAGRVQRKTGARVAVFTQHHADQLDLAKSALENLVFRYPAAGEAALRAHLGRHDVGGDLALRPCRSLSGGQKSRVAFAALTFAQPHVLVMDEPSNHLDLETTDALVGALRAFKGGLVVVSHDQHFINQVCRELWVVGDAALRRFEGTFDDYKAEALRLRQLALEAPRA